jgi:hypothetical protein
MLAQVPGSELDSVAVFEPQDNALTEPDVWCSNQAHNILRGTELPLDIAYRFTRAAELANEEAGLFTRLYQAGVRRVFWVVDASSPRRLPPVSHRIITLNGSDGFTDSFREHEVREVMRSLPDMRKERLATS